MGICSVCNRGLFSLSDQIQTYCYVLYFPDHCRALICRAANTCSKIRSLGSQLSATTIWREEFLSVDNVGLRGLSSIDDWLHQSRPLNIWYSGTCLNVWSCAQSCIQKIVYKYYIHIMLCPCSLYITLSHRKETYFELHI